MHGALISNLGEGQENQDHLGYTELQGVGEQPSHGLGRMESLGEAPNLKASLGYMRHHLKKAKQTNKQTPELISWLCLPAWQAG